MSKACSPTRTRLRVSVAKSASKSEAVYRQSVGGLFGSRFVSRRGGALCRSHHACALRLGCLVVLVVE
jgi:hypothetical protein